MIPSRFVRATLFAGVTITLAISSTGLAASQCKGLAEAACTTDDSCRWIGAYERSDGRQVSAHCRLARSAKQAAKAQPLEAKVSSAD
jgi:acyl-coenzyme A thioesterase PaaI-like protein